MQDSLNTIWNLKVKSDGAWQIMLKNRLISFSMVAGLGFLLVATLLINTLLERFMGKLQEMFPSVSVVVIYVVNQFFTLLVVTTLFTVVFKVLPDAILKLKDVAVGAIFTAILFMIGKFGFTLYITRSNFGTTYGAAIRR